LQEPIGHRKVSSGNNGFVVPPKCSTLEHQWFTALSKKLGLTIPFPLTDSVLPSDWLG
jgi:hypothetical protein